MAGPMEHVEIPKSEPANNDLQFRRPRLSRRRIARELGIDRETVGRYLRLAKPAIPTAGSEGVGEVKPAISIAGFEEAGEAEPAISTAGIGAGRKGQCEPLAEMLKAKAELGLSAQRIYQDLVGENGFTDSYQSVKRFVRKLREAQPERVWRLECQPGEELQLDFGLGAPIDDGQGKKRRSWVLRMVLSYSRKAYRGRGWVAPCVLRACRRRSR